VLSRGVLLEQPVDGFSQQCSARPAIIACLRGQWCSLGGERLMHPQIACGGNHTLAVCEHNAASTNELITQQRRVMQRRMDTRRIPAQLSLPLPNSMRAPHLGVQPSPSSMARMTDTRRALASPSPGPSGRPTSTGGAGLASVSPSLQRLATMSGESSGTGGSKKGAWGFLKGMVGIGGEPASPRSADNPGSRRQKGPGMMHELSPRNAPGRLRLGRRFTFMRRISTAGGSSGSRTPNSFTTALEGMARDEGGRDGVDPSPASAGRQAGQREGAEHAEPAPRPRVEIATGSFTEVLPSGSMYLRTSSRCCHHQLRGGGVLSSWQ
jgi:hypothetical protein